jgi:hypothetical protein
MAVALGQAPVVTRRRFTVAEYHLMANAGILMEDDRVELIDGEILTMSPIGAAHGECVDSFDEISCRRCRSLQRRRRLVQMILAVEEHHGHRFVRLGVVHAQCPDVAGLPFGDRQHSCLPRPDEPIKPAGLDRHPGNTRVNINGSLFSLHSRAVPPWRRGVTRRYRRLRGVFS